MARVELSRTADRDLNDIYIYSYREFGEAKADAYLHALEQCFEQLALFPGIGRSIHHIRQGYFRFPHASHTVFYVNIPEGIRVVRVPTSAHGPRAPLVAVCVILCGEALVIGH